MSLLSIILIICLGTIVYSNTFFCSFHFDDIRFIVDNPAIRNIYDVSGIWHYFHGRFVIFLSLAFNYHFNGLNVFGYHIFNVAVHLMAAILVWWLTLLTLSTPALKDTANGGAGNKITGHADLIALFTGLIFVSHPIQIEAVTNIWQRAASMAALFYLASLCLYVKSRLLPGHSSLLVRFCYIGSLITAVVAMFTKENTVTLPLMILIYEFSFLREKGTGKKGTTLRVSPFPPFSILPFLLTIFIIPITQLYIKTETFQDFHGNLNGPGGAIITPMHYFLTQIRVIVTYIRLVFFPINQNLDYDYPVFKNILEFPVLFSSLFLMAIFYYAKHLFSKYRLVSFSIFWFFLTLTIPESSFWPLGDVISEHRLYLPLAGYSIFLASGVYYLLCGGDTLKGVPTKKGVPIICIVLTMIVLCNSVLTYQRNKVWKNEFTLWDDTVQKSPHKARPYSYRGSAWFDRGNSTQAMLDFNKAIELNPYDVQSYNNRGNLYVTQGKFTQAITDFDKVIELTPYLAEPYYSRGFIYAKEGKFSLAISDFDKVIAIDPTNALAYYNRGLIYSSQGNSTQAILDYNEAIKNDNNYGAAYNNRAICYYQLKEYDHAWGDARKAKALGYAVNPGFINALSQASGGDH